VVDSGALEVTEVSRVIGSLVHVVHADSHIRTHSRSYPTSPRPGLRPLRCAALPADRPFASPRSLASPSWTPQRRYTTLIPNCPGTRLYPRELSPCLNTPKSSRPLRPSLSLPTPPTLVSSHPLVPEAPPPRQRLA
jgi:hypothetical protein